MKAKSKDTSGQFPAQVHAEGQDELRLVVTNLLGGTEAVLTLKGERYSIEVPNRPDQTQSGDSSWGGIPLRWAQILFLGKFPCPDLKRITQLNPQWLTDGGLRVDTPDELGHPSETFIYRIKNVAGRAWSEAMRWERRGVAGSPVAWVEFKFEDPDSNTRSPKKWEARSEVGEVRVKWKDRQSALLR